MGCGESSSVAPLTEDGQIDLTQEIKRYENMLKSQELLVESYKNELNKINEHSNNKKQSFKEKKHIEFNKKVKTMFEIDKQTIATLKDDTLFHDTNFEYFDYSIGEKDNSSPIQWLRPYEIVPTPNIDLESINPNDVRQGTLGKRTKSSLVC